MKNKKYRNLIVIFTLLLLSACSSKIIYNNLDWITYWYIDDYVTLTSEQESEFDPALQQFLLWHRKSELQSYINQIKRIQQDINNGIKQSDIKEHFQVLIGFWQTILVRIEPGLVRLAYSLTDEQVEQFLNATEQRNRDQIEEHEGLSSDKRLNKRLVKIENRIESYTGNLSPAQKQLIKNSNAQLLSTFDEWITYRRIWADSIKEAYALKESKPAFEKALSGSILQADSLRSDQFLKKIEHNQQLWTVTLEQLINSLNKKQLKKLNNKLQNIIEDLQALL